MDLSSQLRFVFVFVSDKVLEDKDVIFVEAVVDETEP